MRPLQETLTPLGFTLLEDKRRNSMFKDYESVSAMFATLEGITLERYIIKFRIGKVKEQLVYSSQKMSDIAFSLGFSSVAHLSAQFRNETGLTPSHFKKIRQEKSSLSKRDD